jgi:hypothetical protein
MTVHGRPGTFERRRYLSSEFLQFVAALVLFAAILIGSYWFVYAPSRRRKRRDSEEERR